MRFLKALLMAMANLAVSTAKGAWSATWQFADGCWRMAWSWLPGGGGGGTAMPREKLDLPDVDEAHETKEAAADQQRAADYMLSSPERVALAWARATKDERDSIPLTKLTDDQIDWLEVRLSDDQIKILASEKSEFKVSAALAGQEDAIPGVPSVPLKKRKSGPDLTDRISEFRALGIERPPAYVH
ncbi:hypothetical protein ELI02_02055 [Rhizobium leguminosarum]|uniref:hypothetical protein n=1 Tax=Rhizobium leguminosarum TaxID=384 RepID=UPI0010305259|nr:hypothetical protein [Rhizobium leguminosarum]TAX58903.1 hypothetical protein ELI02_02055 [Rhizobium leguminosarum]